MKKNNIRILTIALVFALVLSFSIVFVACNDNDNGGNNPPHVESSIYDALKGSSDRVILFIGDGMGVNHVKTGEAYFGRTLFEGFDQTGLVNTSCKAVNQATDSAAAASAMATGEKYFRGYVSYKDSKNFQTISEYAKSLGKGVGIVTTDTLSGATPAAFSAHAKDRGDKATIIDCQINSGIDIFLGAGLTTWDGDDVNYDMYRTQFEEKGYTFCDAYSELSLDSSKVIGAFSEIANYDSTDETPTLKQLSEFAVDFLEAKYPNGYFLMIEGAHIDKMSSKKDMDGMLAYLDEFDNAVEAVKAQMSGKDDYSLILTADHECGDLQYNGETKEQINSSMFHATYHTKADVYYYTDFKLKNGTQFDFVKNIDNTDIFKMCYALISNK